MNKQKNKKQEQVNKPNEQSGVHVDDHIKIFDPNTNEVIVNKRN